MDKIENLQEKARAFRRLLDLYAPRDIDAQLLLRWLTPLFGAIERGEIVPPRKYEFHMALGKEPEFYERHKDVHSVESDFMCALEDWESQSWYKQLKSHRS